MAGPRSQKPVVTTITHLMLDIDGVIICGRPADGLSWKTDLEADLGVSPDALREHFFKPHWGKIVTGQVEIRPVLTQALKEIAPQVSAATLIDYWFSRDARLNTALLDEVTAARQAGLKVFLTTNQEHERARYLWDQLGLRHYAEGIITSGFLGTKKPESYFFKAATKFTHAPTSEHLLVDDSQENIDAARKAGWNAELWDESQTLTQILAGVSAQNHT